MHAWTSVGIYELEPSFNDVLLAASPTLAMADTIASDIPRITNPGNVSDWKNEATYHAAEAGITRSFIPGKRAVKTLGSHPVESSKWC
jgi:hypothetical protein